MRRGRAEGFTPAWWLRNPHLQTLWPTFLRRLPDVAPRRERVDLPDGDFLDLDWYPGRTPPAAPTVLILHGLEGSSESPYARGMLAACAARGWQGVVMHFRGCGGEPNRLERGYHSGDTVDPAHVIDHLRASRQGALAAVGFSLGGNVLLKWLGETGSRCPLRAAAAVSVPFELARCAARLTHGLSRVYQWWLMRSMRESVRTKFDRLGRATTVDLSRVAASTTFHEFDDAYTAPAHGFRDVHDYYARSSSRQYLAGISVPTLLVQSTDDPFMTPEVIPPPYELPDAVTLEVTPHGGHVGFVSGRVPGRPEYWLERRIPEFLARELGEG